MKLLLLLLLSPYLYCGTHFTKEKKPIQVRMNIPLHDGRIVTTYMNSIYSKHYKNFNCNECGIVPNIVFEVSDRPFVYCLYHIREMFPDIIDRLRLK